LLKYNTTVIAIYVERYDKTNYLNISEKSNLQKKLLDASLLCYDYKLFDYNSYIEEFNNYKLSTSLKDIDIYEVKKIQDIVSVKAKAYVSSKSDTMKDWNQETFYNLNFFLENKGFCAYLINYIKEVETHIKLSNDDEEHHDHHLH